MVVEIFGVIGEGELQFDQLIGQAGTLAQRSIMAWNLPGQSC